MKMAKKLLFLLIVAALCALALVGCGGGATIALKDDAMPQLVFVLGEDIDLSGGRLALTDKNGTTDLAMDAEGVTVSGYDKNTLGEQTVTVSYGKSSVQLKVNVVERMQAVDVATEYLVGDQFNRATGKLKITRNDGSTYTVVLNSDKVKVEGFDSTAEGECEVTLTYTSGSDSFSTKLNVGIYDPDDVTFVKPNKVTYKSHDEGLDLSGGYLTLKALNGKLEKDVKLTEDMLAEAFDLSEVTKENSPLTKAVVINFGGKEYSFDVVITYTSVTEFKANAHLTHDYDFTVDFLENESLEPAITDEVGEMALELMRLYSEMSPAEKSLISKKDTMSVARTAMLYALNAWSDEIELFEDAFTFSQGQLMLTCVNEAAVREAIELLADTDRPIYDLPAVMGSIVSSFEEEVFFYEYNFGDFGVADPESFEGLSELFEYMLLLDEKADLIGEDWKTVGISTYSSAVAALYDAMMNSDYASYTYSQIYYAISMWRTDDDLFDALYTYYYDIEDVESLVSLALIRLPSELEEIFYYLMNAMDAMDTIAAGGATDTSLLFYNYYKALELRDALIEGDNAMMKDFYLALPLNGLIGMGGDTLYYFETAFEYIRTGEGGVSATAGPLLGDPDYDAVMGKYMDMIIRLFDDESYDASAAYNSDVEELLALYMDLTPVEQFSFLGSLNAFYAMGMPQFAFDPKMDMQGEIIDLSCAFVTMLTNYYEELFEGEAAKAVFVDLMIATEAYAQRYTNGEWMNEMRERLTAVGTAVAGMSTTDRSVFETKLKYIYDEYTAIFAEAELPSATPELGEWADEFEALKNAMLEVELSYQLVSGGYNYYTLYFSAFERVQAISADIMKNGSDVAKHAYVYIGLYSSDEFALWMDPEAEIDPETTVYWTYDYVVSIYRAVYVNALLSMMQGNSIYDYYVSENMGEFLNSAYDLVWPYLWTSEDAPAAYDNAKAVDAIAKYFALSIDARTIFALLIEGEYSLFFTSFEDYALTKSESVSDLLTAMVELDFEVLTYASIMDEDTLASVKTSLAELEAAYALLSGDGKSEFAPFEQIYLEYVKSVKDMIAEAEAAPEA